MKPHKGSWRTIYYCNGCGLHSEYQYYLFPCPDCGESRSESFTARHVKYSWLAKIFAKLSSVQLNDHWEYNGDVPKIPKHNIHVPQPRIELLKLQQELIELMPDKFDICLEEDRVSIKRL